MTCRHFGACGGCSLPDVAYPEQLTQKEARLAAWFPGVRLEPILASPQQEAFRHKVAFVFNDTTMGHYRAGSRRVIPIAECPVHSARGNQIAFRLRDCLAAARVPPGILRHVLIRTTDDGREAVAMLVVRMNHKTLRAPIRAFLAAPHPPDGFFLNIHDRDDAYMIGRETLHLAGRRHVCEEVLGTRFLVSPTAFFQTNVRAARVLVERVLGWVETSPAGLKSRRSDDEPRGPRASVLDLYSGSGLFALPLARAGARVVAVEENRQAVKDAEANLRLNRVPGHAVRLIPRRVEDALASLTRDRFDVVVLDPPRQGCAEPVIDRVCAVRPSRIVYVSCNPERLAVERTRFERQGFRLDTLQAVDMFPHTDHIEAVARFEPARARPS